MSDPNHENQSKVFADNIVRFETALASKMFKPAEMRIPENTYNKRSTKVIAEMIHPFDFNLYIEQRGMTQFDTAIVGTVQFMENIPSMSLMTKQLWSSLSSVTLLLNK